jgi:hypothetical protein
MRRTNQNVILSHGGKHGGQSKTLLKGQVVPAAAAQHVPDAAMDARKGNPGTQDVPADSTKKANAVVQTSAKEAHAASKAAPVVVKAAAATPAPAKPPGTERMKAPKAPKPPKVRAPESPPKVEDPLVMESQDPLATEPVSEPAGPPAAEETGEASETVTVPSSKRALKRMSKADSYTLAQDLALDVPAIGDITLKNLHRKLAVELGL